MFKRKNSIFIKGKVGERGDFFSQIFHIFLPQSFFGSNHNMYERREDRNPSRCEQASPSTQFSHRNCKQPRVNWYVLHYSTLRNCNSTQKLRQARLGGVKLP